ncbi:hypothetical protein E1200_04015 [Actinomadura sp. GC306]|uniref:DUF6193 family natural product biosynthesis protein n=1 Tax=Actinomadura sp. GC306 TaxID=2530367 RepID=UPI001053A550|nr:DUF6193 family natural product biosynthesis protein [Actinomadura sp. GC306]TDC70780.1 hypothetical protein E1200_04015 [Actinomadura sp. GC306]
MVDDRRSSHAEFYATVDNGLYLDVISAGSLKSALLGAATRQGIELEGVEAAPGQVRFTAPDTVSAGRSASVLLGAEERLFSMIVSQKRFLYATGGTDDLASVVKVISFWFEGSTLTELTARFPFMSHTRMAASFEQGDAVDFQWQALLEDDDFLEIRPLLFAVHTVEGLRSLFPLISHNTQLRLHDDVNLRNARQFWVTMQSGGRYRVELRGGLPRAEIVDSLAAAIDVLASYVGSPKSK